MLTTKQENDIQNLPDKWRQRARNIKLEAKKTNNQTKIKTAHIVAQVFEDCSEELERVVYRYEKKSKNK